MNEMEAMLKKKRRELTHNEGLMVQYSENLKELEMQFDRREQELINLR